MKKVYVKPCMEVIDVEYHLLTGSDDWQGNSQRDPYISPQYEDW